MNEMNETQLRGWRPRRPSRALKNRIFADATADYAEGRREVVKWNWSCATPALVCVVFATLMFHFNGAEVLHESKPSLAMISSNQTRVASFSDSAQETENHMASITFDWTNHTSFQSSIGFTPATNLSN